jgi:hypothetical protein
MATYKDRLKWLVDRGFIGVTEETYDGHKWAVLYIEGVELEVSDPALPVEKAIDELMERGVAGTHE